MIVFYVVLSLFNVATLTAVEMAPLWRVWCVIATWLFGFLTADYLDNLRREVEAETRAEYENDDEDEPSIEVKAVDPPSVDLPLATRNPTDGAR